MPFDALLVAVALAVVALGLASAPNSTARPFPPDRPPRGRRLRALCQPAS